MTRLMCSENPEKVAAVRSELFKAGICSQIRKNPVTELLQIKRLELWLENERDLFAARELYTAMQARGENGDEPAMTKNPAGTPIEMRALPAPSMGVVSAPRPAPDGKDKNQPPCGELEEASKLLEREIEEALQREESLSETCAALRREVESLRRSLSESQAAVEKAAAELTRVRSSLEGELTERARSEKHLAGQIRELQGEQDANHRLVSKAQAELVVERQSRIAAEEQAAKSVQAQERLDKQLAEQADLQEKLRTSIGSMNSLRSRLQAKRKFVE